MLHFRGFGPRWLRLICLQLGISPDGIFTIALVSLSINGQPFTFTSLRPSPDLVSQQAAHSL